MIKFVSGESGLELVQSKDILMSQQTLMPSENMKNW